MKVKFFEEGDTVTYKGRRATITEMTPARNVITFDDDGSLLQVYLEDIRHFDPFERWFVFAGTDFHKHQYWEEFTDEREAFKVAESAVRGNGTTRYVYRGRTPDAAVEVAEVYLFSEIRVRHAK